jgi:hypothetical protein
MKTQKPALYSFGHAVLVLAYVSGVAALMFNGERLFGNGKNILIPIGMLLLFVFSATITGTLVLGRPILLYIDGAKSEAIKFFAYTLGWIFLIMCTVFIALSFINR